MVVVRGALESLVRLYSRAKVAYKWLYGGAKVSQRWWLNAVPANATYASTCLTNAVFTNTTA
jgi:hypothetical protein